MHMALFRVRDGFISAKVSEIFYEPLGDWKIGDECWDNPSRTFGQCLNATNSSGKNAYRTFLKYLQESFNLAYVHNARSTLIIKLENVCIQSDVIVACEKMQLHCILVPLCVWEVPKRFDMQFPY